jgi:hypothetical protein
MLQVFLKILEILIYKGVATFLNKHNIISEAQNDFRGMKYRNSDISKEVGLEVYLEKTKYMLMSHHNHNIIIANGSYNDVAKFRHL